MNPSTESAGEVYRAIADPTRRRILDLLAAEPRSVQALCERFETSQPAISQHVRVLREARLVEARVEWRHRIYYVRKGALRDAHEWVSQFERFWDDALGRLAQVVEDAEDDGV
jgi:DNA-binding transcriptional ArsR family regulator